MDGGSWPTIVPGGGPRRSERMVDGEVRRGGRRPATSEAEDGQSEKVVMATGRVTTSRQIATTGVLVVSSPRSLALFLRTCPADRTRNGVHPCTPTRPARYLFPH